MLQMFFYIVTTVLQFSPLIAGAVVFWLTFTWLTAIKVIGTSRVHVTVHTKLRGNQPWQTSCHLQRTYNESKRSRVSRVLTSIHNDLELATISSYMTPYSSSTQRSFRRADADRSAVVSADWKVWQHSTYRPTYITKTTAPRRALFHHKSA